jgi:DNA (cytosine-5)-methyltransferase 1
LPYEIKNTCDCDANAVLSYAAMRYDLDKEMKAFEFPSQDEMVEYLQSKNVGYDFQNDKHTIIKRTPLTKLKQYYIADKLSKNLGDISKVERLPYADLVTYSYPCTDISCSGKTEGMVNKCDKCGNTWPIDFEKPEFNNKCSECGNVDIRSTRSGLLGQVQRLLAIAYQENTLPKYLILENVKNLVGKKFKAQFEAWIKWLDLIGYNTYWKIENAKCKGIPQSRERVFAVSIRKDIDDNSFKFPEDIKLKIRLKDVLEQNVDEKYYLPDERLEKILDATFMKQIKPAGSAEVRQIMNVMPGTNRPNPNQGRVYDIEGIAPSLTTMEGGGRQPFIIEEDAPEIQKVLDIPKDILNDNERQRRVYSPNGVNPTLLNRSDSPKIQVIGNYSPSGHDASRVVDIEGIAPTVKENHGTVTAIAEPFVVASRGRNPDNPSDRTAGTPTEQRLEPNFSGCSNTPTSVQKDNYVCEHMIVEDFYQGREPRVYQETAPTLRSERVGLKVADENTEYPCSTRGKQVASALRASIYKQGARNLEENVLNGLGYEGVVEEEIPKIKWRIRKLTSKECWRLMNFTDIDHDRAANYVSPSALYKQAGNSIVVACLIGIMSSLFIKDGYKSEVWTKHTLNFNDN